MQLMDSLGRQQCRLRLVAEGASPMHVQMKSVIGDESGEEVLQALDSILYSGHRRLPGIPRVSRRGCPNPLTFNIAKTKNRSELIMLELGELNENNVQTVIASGRLTKEDYTRLLPALERLLKEHEAIRFYIKLEDFQGFTIEALWEDIKFDYRHQKKYGKTAIVGHDRWEEWGTKVSKLFFDAEMKFFYADQTDEAWEWVNS